MSSAVEHQLEEWSKHRRRLEQETRVLVVEEEESVREQIDDILHGLQLSARSVASADQALEILSHQAYPLVLASESLDGLGGVYLARQLRTTHFDVDVLLCSWEPTIALLSKAFEMRVLDVIPKPLPSPEIFGWQIGGAIRRSLGRRMRAHVLKDLRDSLGRLPPEARLRTTGVLEKRLSTFKGYVGAFDRVLVVEGDDPEFRVLSESLLLAGLHVETVATDKDALSHVATGDVHLLLLNASLDQGALTALLAELRETNPLVELVLVTGSPRLEHALAALRRTVGYFGLPLPAMGLAPRVQDILRRSRRERLFDNLLTELFRETSRFLPGLPPPECFGVFCEVVGLERLIPEPPQCRPSRVEAVEAVEYLDEVLDGLLAPDEVLVVEDTPGLEPPLAATVDASDRRAHLRVPESQFIRFRTKPAPASTLALVGDLSVGGLFIRSGELLLPGTIVELDFNIVCQDQGYLVRCRGQVAWVARDNQVSPLGPGFGIKFIDPPGEVAGLIEQIVEARVKELGVFPEAEAGED
jgi:DNA-binding response OmpR family regulator